MSTTQVRISTKGWSLQSLITYSQNFKPVDRVAAGSHGMLQVLKDHEQRGLPLVIEDFHRHEGWPKDMFTLENYKENAKSTELCVRNVHSWTEKNMELSEFIYRSRLAGSFVEEGESERFYGKDADCPNAWDKWLQESDVLPASVLSHGPEDEFRFRPASSRIETLMCYLGVGDTFTPSHKDLCASAGQNLMCYTEGNGSSFWFMTESSDALTASMYFHKLGYELDHENHVVSLEQFSKAPFQIYVLEQKLGDLVLVPPRSCHQVVNYGGITIKTSWSRMTLRGLSIAYHHELPIYRRVGRPETYRIKSTIYYALTGRIKELAHSMHSGRSSQPSPAKGLADAINASTGNFQAPHASNSKEDLLASELKRLLFLYDLILAEERPGLLIGTCRHLDQSQSFDDDCRIVCDFCDCDIFQTFFECARCEGRIVCSGCYAEGRSCRCLIMEPMQCRQFQILIDAKQEAVNVLRIYEEKRGGTASYMDPVRSGNDAPRLFFAACVLLQMRKGAKKPTKVCSQVQHYNHEVPFAWALHCLPCHRSSCFDYILNHFNMHSAEALLLFDTDNSRNEYHQRHCLSVSRYHNSSDDVQKSQREGSPMDGHILLAHIALQYGSCIPSNPKSLNGGWYDHFPKMPETEPRKLTIRIPASRNPLPKRQSQKRKMQVYVEVPPPPYPIPRKQRILSDYESRPSNGRGVPSQQGENSSSLVLSPKRHAGPSANTMRHTGLTNLNPNSPSVALKGKAQRTPPKSAMRKVPEPISPLRYIEDQAAKKAVYSKLSFKKNLPTPHEDGSAMIQSSQSEGSSVNLVSPSSSGTSFLGGAQYVRQSEHNLPSSEPVITGLLELIATPNCSPDSSFFGHFAPPSGIYLQSPSVSTEQKSGPCTHNPT